MLGAGVLYGAYHHNRLSKKEAAWREVEAKKKIVRDAQLAIEKKRNYESWLRCVCCAKAPKKTIHSNSDFFPVAVEMKAIEELSKPALKTV